MEISIFLRNKIDSAFRQITRVAGNYIVNFKCQKFAWDLANYHFLGQKLHMGAKILKIGQRLDMPTSNQSFTT